MQGTKYEIFKDPQKLKKYNLIPPKVMLFSDKVLTKKNIKSNSSFQYITHFLILEIEK